MAKATASRAARFSVEKAANFSVLRVSVPGKLNPREFESVQKRAIDQIGKLSGHTGCLSGKFKLLIEEDFSKTIAEFDLRTM